MTAIPSYPPLLHESARRKAFTQREERVQLQETEKWFILLKRPGRCSSKRDTPGFNQ